MRAGERPESLFDVNVLAGLAGGVVDAVLEREDDPERDPFAVALETYRTRGAPEDMQPAWRGRGGASDEAATQVLRKLDRDLLVGVVRYATGPTEPAVDESAVQTGPVPPLAVIGAGGVMPALELASDGTWHVAERPGIAESRPAADRTKASVPTLASRYPEARPRDRY